MSIKLQAISCKQEKLRAVSLENAAFELMGLKLVA
jgi:hypothetical protein